MTKIIPQKEVSGDWTEDQKASLNSHGGIKKADGVRTIDASGMSQEEYIAKAVAARNEDLVRLRKLMKKRDDVRAKNFNMFGFVGWALAHDDLIKREEDLDIKIANVMRDIQFNQQAIMNTMPSAPPIPPQLMPPAPPNQKFVNTGTQMRCIMSAIPTQFIADPNRTVFIEGAQMGNIMDNKISNLRPGMMCQSLANPAVASATAAAMGVLTPQPSMLTPLGPWIMGKFNVLVQGQPALLNTDMLMCSFGGQLSFTPSPPAAGGGPGLGGAAQNAAQLVGWQAAENWLTLKSGSPGASQGAIVVIQGLIDIASGKTENNPQSWQEAVDRIDRNNEELRKLTEGDAEDILNNAPRILEVGTDTARRTFEGAFNEHRNNARKAINEQYDKEEQEIRDSDSPAWWKEVRMKNCILNRSMDLAGADLIGHFGSIGGTFLGGVGGAMSTGAQIGISAGKSINEVIDYKTNRYLMDDDSDIFGSAEAAELYADRPDDLKIDDKGSAWLIDF